MTDRDDDDGTKRDEHGERLPVDVDRRSGSGSLSDILRATQASVSKRAEAHERRIAEAAKHRATCQAEECRTCERVKCYRCGAIKQGIAGMCQACRDRESYERAKERVLSSIPRRFRWAIDGNLSTLTERVRLPADRISAALTWASRLGSIPPSLAISGVTGAGKTSLTVAMFAAWFARSRVESARFVTAIELGLARARHPLGHDDPQEVLAAIAAPLLILDDLGAESPLYADVIRQVLHARHNADLPTWITTGLHRPDVATRYDGGLARRIYEQAKHVELGVDP